MPEVVRRFGERVPGGPDIAVPRHRAELIDHRTA
jgi:hypothetical protein